jgi:glycerol-3-phosphate cytidylyltransferase
MSNSDLSPRFADTALPLDQSGMLRPSAHFAASEVSSKSFRVVLVQGAFDILHLGHIKVFEFARKQGDYLIVALNTNELIRSYKGREAVMDWGAKKAVIEAIRCVDLVVPATEFSPLKLLIEHHVEVYVVAEEWKHTKAEEIAYMERTGGRTVVTPRFTDLSTTEIKRLLLEEHLRQTTSAP